MSILVSAKERITPFDQCATYRLATSKHANGPRRQHAECLHAGSHQMDDGTRPLPRHLADADARAYRPLRLAGLCHLAHATSKGCHVRLVGSDALRSVPGVDRRAGSQWHGVVLCGGPPGLLATAGTAWYEESMASLYNLALTMRNDCVTTWLIQPNGPRDAIVFPYIPRCCAWTFNDRISVFRQSNPAATTDHSY